MCVRERENLHGGHILSTHLSHSSVFQLEALFSPCPKPCSTLWHMEFQCKTSNLDLLSSRDTQDMARLLYTFCAPHKAFSWTLNTLLLTITQSQVTSVILHILQLSKWGFTNLSQHKKIIQYHKSVLLLPNFF